MSNRYLIGAYAIGALPVGKAVTRTPPRSAPKSSSPAAATRAAPAAASAAGAKPNVAAPPAKTKPKPVSPAADAAKKSAKAHLTSASQRAAAAGNKLARRHPGMSRTLLSLSKTASAKAQTIKGLERHPLLAVIGDDAADSASANSAATGVDQAARAGEIAVKVYDYIDKLYAANQKALAHEGEMIIDAANYVVVTIEQMRRSNSQM